MTAAANKRNGEEWRAVPGFGDWYEVSSDGSVRSWHPWRGTEVPRVLRPSTEAGGYPHVVLYDELGKHPVNVHALVAKAFLGPCPIGQEVRHKNGINTDCRRENLEYGTRQQNLLDKRRHGTDHNARKTHCPSGHPYDEENTKIRTDRGWIGRECRTCRNSKARQRRAA